MDGQRPAGPFQQGNALDFYENRYIVMDLINGMGLMALISTRLQMAPEWATYPRPAIRYGILESSQHTPATAPGAPRTPGHLNPFPPIFT